jgi:hypothetical protein
MAVMLLSGFLKNETRNNQNAAESITTGINKDGKKKNAQTQSINNSTKLSIRVG